MSEQGGQKNPQETQSSFRSRLAEKANAVLPAGVKAVVDQARRVSSPRQALSKLAELSREVQQKRASAKEDREREEQQQREAKVLVAEIDRLFPDDLKNYSTGYGVYKSYKEWENMGGNRERADSASTYHTPAGEQVALSEDRPSYTRTRATEREIFN